MNLGLNPAWEGSEIRGMWCVVGLGESWWLFLGGLNSHEDRGRGFALGMPHTRVQPWVLIGTAAGAGAPEHRPALVRLPWRSRTLPGDEHRWALAQLSLPCLLAQGPRFEVGRRGTALLGGSVFAQSMEGAQGGAGADPFPWQRGWSCSRARLGEAEAKGSAL